MSLQCIWCANWKPGIEKIDGPIVLHSIRAGRDLYDGKPFKFCPWCGHELQAVAAAVPVVAAPSPEGAEAATAGVAPKEKP